QAGARLGYGADAILRGAGAQVSATDTVTTSALRDLERSTEEAQALANKEAVAGQGGTPDPNAELVAQLQSLRRQLADPEQQARQQLQDASRDLLTRSADLLKGDAQGRKLSDEEIKAVRALGDALRGSITGNPALIDQQLQSLVNLTEQLELKLASGTTGAER